MKDDLETRLRDRLNKVKPGLGNEIIKNGYIQIWDRQIRLED
jgi:hypothetical protein